MSFGAIPLPIFSVNRGKYSEPSDVLIEKRMGWHVGEFRVDDLPPEEISNDGKKDRKFMLGVEDDPQPDNDAHAEVCSYRDKVRRNPRQKLPQRVKLAFRTHLMQRIKIVT